MYKYLFFIPSPRAIPEVKKPIVDLLYKKHDVIWYKYFREIDAYDKAQEFFFNSKENYDYLVIIPDDMILNKAGVDNILQELENPSIGVPFYKILSGICNVSFTNQEQMDSIAASTAILPTSDKQVGYPVWDHMIKFADLEARPENIFQCKFIGFSFYFIHRSVLEEVPFRSPGPEVPKDGMDTFFCQDLEDAGIKQYIDKRSRFVHLRGLSAQSVNSITVNPDVLLVGKLRPYVIFVPRLKVDDYIPATRNPSTVGIVNGLLDKSEQIRRIQYEDEAKAVPIPTQFEPATTFSGPYKGEPAKAVPLSKKKNKKKTK